jgi:hypothetical protein
MTAPAAIKPPPTAKEIVEAVAAERAESEFA